MTELIDGIEYLTAAAAARELATTEMKVLMLLKKGALKGEMIDGSWFVTAASLSCYDPKSATPETDSSCRTSCKASSCGCH